MKRFTQQFKKQADSVKLSASERADLRERVQAYMEYHPLPKTAPTKQPAAAPVSHEPFSIVTISWRRFLPIGAGAFAIILAIVPVLAERSVPGDTLYAVKVGFNEEVRSTLTFDSVQKVEWETERLNRRIAEARLLANEGRLTEDVEAEVAEAVRTHSENAQREIAALREEDAEEAVLATIALDTVLEVQASTFAQEDSDAAVATMAAAQAESPDTTVLEPVATANLIADAINESRSQNEPMNASSTPSYAKLMAKIEQNTTRIYELRRTVEPYLGDERIVEVDRRIADTERAIQEAIEQATTDEVAVRTELVDVLQRTQRLIVYLTELEVSATIDLERLVPKVLTPEEQRVELETRLDTIEEYGQILDTLLVEVELTPDEREKVDRLQDQATELLTEIDGASEAEVKLALAKNARELLNDAVLMLEAKLTGPTGNGTTTPAVGEEATSTPPEESSERPTMPTTTPTSTPTTESPTPATSSDPVGGEATSTGSTTASVDTPVSSTSVELGTTVDIR